jgi:hypothetical protein
MSSSPEPMQTPGILGRVRDQSHITSRHNVKKVIYVTNCPPYSFEPTKALVTPSPEGQLLPVMR